MADDLGLKVGISGVRGVVGEGLTVEETLAFARAFATCTKGRGKTVAIGRDTRVTGEMLRAAVVAGLLQSGADIVDLGILPVPSFQTAIRLDETLKGGVYISASHNPGDQNGLKFFRPDGVILYPQQAQELIATRDAGEFATAAPKRLGTVTAREGAVEDHINAIVKLVDCDVIRKARLRVVLDCNNGAGAQDDCTKRLLERLGVAEVEVMNGDPTGIFSHKPEPVPAHMKALAAKVGELEAHVGFSQDPDADRAAIAACVEGRKGIAGRAIGEEFTLALGAASVAAQAKARGHKVSMACNYSTSRMIEEIAHDHDFPFMRTAVGEINVVEGLQKLERRWRRKHPKDRRHFCFGGEGGGGIIDPRNQYCRDSLNSIALILQGLAQWKREEDAGGGPECLLLDRWRKAALEPCEIVKDTMTFESLARQDRVMKAAFKHYGKADVPEENIADDDGIRVKYPDRSWVHVRPSNTEPIVRFIAEHDTKRQAKAMVDEAMEIARAALK